MNARMTILWLLCVVIFAALGLYLDHRQVKPALAAKPVPFLETPPAKDAWYDVRFAATVEPHGSDIRILHLRNTYENRLVGLDVLVQGKFRAALKFDGGSARIDSDALQGLKVTFKRSGTESDQLLKVLDQLYGTKIFPATMIQSFSLEAIPLQGENDGFAKVKLFGNSNGPQDGYFELFLNVNFKEGWAELAEKDPDYRRPMIKSLASNSQTR